MQSWMSNRQLDIQIFYHFECRAEHQPRSSIFETYVFECRAECRTQNSIFKVRVILNAELHIDPTARNPRWIFSNAELNVEIIARYSKCYGFECRAECWTHSSTFKVCIVLNAELNVDLIARYSGWIYSNAELNVEHIALNIQIVYYFECRAERRSHSSIFKKYIFECRAACRTHSSIFKVCIILNAELNVDPIARNSRWMFSNAELNVEPIARYSMCYGFECRAECWTQRSTFKVLWFWMQSWTSIS